MASQVGNLDTFSSTNVDKVHTNTLTASIGIPSIANFGITAISLWLSAVRTYVSDCYLTLTKGTATLNTGIMTNNATTHSETLACSGFNNDWLSVGSGTVTVTVRRTGLGAGAAVNFRDGIYGELTITYENGAKVFVKISGVYKSTSNVYTKVSGSYKGKNRVWVKKSGVWK